MDAILATAAARTPAAENLTMAAIMAASVAALAVLVAVVNRLAKPGRRGGVTTATVVWACVAGGFILTGISGEFDRMDHDALMLHEGVYQPTGTPVAWDKIAAAAGIAYCPCVAWAVATRRATVDHQ